MCFENTASIFKAHVIGSNIFVKHPTLLDITCFMSCTQQSNLLDEVLLC